MIDNDGLLSASDIAELAGVSRAAVSNWRTRYPDFPAATGGTDGRPLFNRSHVTQWLATQNKPLHESAALQVWSSLNSLRDAASVDDLVLEAHSLIAVRHLAVRGNKAATELWADLSRPSTIETASTDRFAQVTEAIMPADVAVQAGRRWAHLATNPAISALVTAISAVDPSELLSTSTLLIERASAAAARAGIGHGFVSSRASAILATAAGTNGPSIYDPACGISEAAQLIAARDPQHSRVTGVDVNADALLIAAVRANLRGLDADFELADVLADDPHPGLSFDIIVAEPPFSLRWEAVGAITDPRWRHGIPPRSSADLAWIQHALAHLVPGGRGYVLTTRGPLARSGTEGRIRADIIKNDLVRAIVGLPGRLLPNTSIQLALWVLGTAQTDEERGNVLIVDASDADTPEDHINNWITAARIDVPSRRVPIAEILADDASLTPARWVGAVVEPPTREGVQEVAARRREERIALTQLPDLDPAYFAPAQRVVRLSELIELGTAQLFAGRVAAGENEDDLVVGPADVRRGLPPMLLRPEGADERRTKAGDVLVTRLSKIYARVDPDGGRVPARGVYVLTPNQDVIDSEYLAHCIAGSWNEALQTGSMILSVKDIEIPMVPIQAQRQIAEQLRSLDVAEAAVQRFSVANAEAAEQLMKAIRYGISSTRS